MMFPFQGKMPVVSPEAFVAPTAQLIGDVAIGKKSSVWYGAVLRGDVQAIRIGDRTSIQDNSVIHATDDWCPTLVGSDVTVGHSVILHGCTVGDRVLVGMGSIVLDEAEIGVDCILGAGSLVTYRTKIPPGVMAYGRPAKPVRDLKPEELKQIMDAAQSYVTATKTYLAE